MDDRFIQDSSCIWQTIDVPYLLTSDPVINEILNKELCRTADYSISISMTLLIIYPTRSPAILSLTPDENFIGAVYTIHRLVSG